MASGVAASEECINAFNDLKLRHKYKYIIYAIASDDKEIVVEKAEPTDNSVSNEEAYEKFLTHLTDARYAVFDFVFEKEDGSGTRNKICFITWSPDTSRIKQKMLYASSKDALRKSLVGIHVDVQGTDYDEVAYETILGKVNKLR